MDTSSATLPKRPSSRLVVETGENQGMIFPLRETVISIGRGPENTIQIIDTQMSRSHSLLLLHEGRWYARDLGSKNGTQINDETIEGDHPVCHGDLLQIGGTTFIFEQDCSPPPDANKISTGVRVLHDEDTPFVARHVMKLREELGNENEISNIYDLPSHDSQRLNLIYQVADMISSILDLDELLGRVLDLIQQFLAPDRAGILLYDEHYNVLLPKVIRRPPNSQDDIVISSSIINKAVSEQVAIHVNDAPHDQRFNAADSIVSQRIQSAICVPLVYKTEVLGVLYLDRRQPKCSYEENDLKLVIGIANQAALAIANTRLHRKLLEQHAQERELEIARSIQENLLPRTMPELPGFEIAGLSRPARMVGGDYFDVIALPDGRYVIAIADVAGKGVPAAILIAAVRAAVQIEVRGLKDEKELLHIIERLNQMVCRDTSSSVFVTMVLGVLDPSRRTLTYCNAGHVHPLLCHRDGHVSSLDVGGCFLGIMPGIHYELSVAPLEPGSILVMYSDGVTDMMNGRREMFGIQRLTDLLVTADRLSAHHLCIKIEQAAQTFRQGAEPFDDFTLLALKSIPA